MKKPDKKMLAIPEGTEAIFLKEAFIHRQITAGIESLFAGWGYLPCLTPVFDFYDIYRPLLKTISSAKIYRLIDRDGDLLMLRPDITLFLARQIAPFLKTIKMPARVSYGDIIMRHQNREDISRNEFFQVGAELIGKKGMDGDLEILSLLMETLIFLDLPEPKIHIGSRKLFDIFFRDYSEKEKSSLMEYLSVRDWESFKKDAGRFSGNNDFAVFLSDLFSFMGTKKEFNVFMEELAKIYPKTAEKRFFSEARDELEYLSEISAHFEENTAAGEIRIDLSETGTQPYHTGIAFQVYVDGLDSSLASGGRYDDLMEYFGHKTYSVGFSLLLRKAVPFMKDKKRFRFPENLEEAKGRTFMERLDKARKIRAERGFAVL